MIDIVQVTGNHAPRGISRLLAMRRSGLVCRLFGRASGRVVAGVPRAAV